MRLAAVTFACLLGSLAPPRAAEAQASLGASSWAAWQAPPECPQEPAFVAQVEGFLGTSLDARQDRKLEIVGRIRTDESRGFVANLRVSTSRGAQQRELDHRDCRELTEAAALIAALAIDPQLVASSVPRSPAPIASPDPLVPAASPEPAAHGAVPGAPVIARPTLARPVAPASTASSRDVPPARERAPLHYSLSALGLFGSSVLPSAGVGTGVDAAAGPRHFRLVAQAVYWLSRFRGLSDAGGAGVELGTWSVSLKGCGLPSSGDVELSLCGGPVVGDMYGTGSGGLTNARTLHDHWSALAAEASVAFASSAGVTTLLGLELQKTLEAPRFGATVDGREVQVFKANAWAVNAFVGLGIFR